MKGKMSHFRNITSPHIILGVSYTYIGLVFLVLYFGGFYRNNSFLRWGVPIKFFGEDIVDDRTFYMLLILIFIHQIVNNCVNSIVYPWIINSVQDPKNKIMEYGKWKSLLLVNLFDIYSQIDVILLVMGITSQISFVVVIIIANIITSTFINYKYIKYKEYDEIV
jgi:hypothetical protein